MQKPATKSRTVVKLETVISLAIAAVCLVLFIVIPNPTKTQVLAMRMGLSIGFGGVAGQILGGTIKVKGKWANFSIVATGAIAVWVVLYLVSPP